MKKVKPPRYRRVALRIHNDPRFRQLSDQQKLLTYTILTHPNLTTFGMLTASIASISDDLNWSFEKTKYELEGFADLRFPKPFPEPFQRKKKRDVLQFFREKKHHFPAFIYWDPDSRLFWLPRFLKYNSPDNPNQVISWDNQADLVPDCQLQLLAFQYLEEFLFHRGDSFFKAIPNGIRYRLPNPPKNRSTNPTPNGSANRYQDPDPEQYPEQNTSGMRAGRAREAGGSVNSSEIASKNDVDEDVDDRDQMSIEEKIEKVKEEYLEEYQIYFDALNLAEGNRAPVALPSLKRVTVGRKVRKAIEEFGVDQAIAAARGVFHVPYNAGENGSRDKHLALVTAMRIEDVERFAKAWEARPETMAVTTGSLPKVTTAESEVDTGLSPGSELGNIRVAIQSRLGEIHSDRLGSDAPDDLVAMWGEELLEAVDADSIHAAGAELESQLQLLIADAAS